MGAQVPSDVKIKFDLTKLNSIVGNLETKMVAKVGILGDKNKRNEAGKSNAEIGATHEYGSFSDNIPKRSFLKDPLFKLRKKELIDGTAKIVNRNLGNENSVKIIYKQLGLLGEYIVKMAFSTGGFGTWKPLSQTTIDKKGSNKILVDTSQLRRSITSKVEVIEK